MKSSQDTAVIGTLHETLPPLAQPQATSRVFCYVEAAAACGVLLFAGVILFTPWY